MARRPWRGKQTLTPRHKIKPAYHPASIGFKIEHYHSANGWFADKAFMKDCEKNAQILTFCAANSHWQNDIAEKKIRDTTESARKQLLHAQSRWSDEIKTNLWPYPLKTEVESGNTIPDKEDASYPLARFSNLPVQEHLKDKHPFGYPVFALQIRLQNQQKFPRWNSRARLGINFGPSPRHARNVNLVLKHETGIC
eukprot:3266943-Ditylum_brightwellii.AAC.1